MSTKDKVFVIVYRNSQNELKFLCLKPNPEPGRNTDYYVITGGIRKNESQKEAVLREVEEEIGVIPDKIVNLHNEIKYQDHLTGKRFVEYCYAAKVETRVLKLNEEHVSYMWADAANFIKLIWWDEDKTKLQKMVETILND